MKQIVLNIRNGEKNTDIAFPCTEDELGKALASIGLVNSPSPKAYVTEVAYNDEVVRKLIECVVIESKDQIKVVFRDGMEMKQTLRRESIDFLLDMGQMRMLV